MPEDVSLFQLLRQMHRVPETKMAPPASSITAQNVLETPHLAPAEIKEFTKMPIMALTAGIEGRHLQTLRNRMGEPFDRASLKAFYLGRDLRHHLGADMADTFVREIERFGRSGSISGLDELSKELVKALGKPGNSALVLLRTIAKRYISRAPQFGAQIGKSLARGP